MKMSLVFLLSAITTVMGVTEYKNNSGHDHLLGLGCQGTNVAYTLPASSTSKVQCPVSTGTHSFTIRNPDSKTIAYFSADGASCDALFNGDFSVPFYQTYSSLGTDASSTTVSGAPCNSNPCCFVVYFVGPSSCALNFDFSWTASADQVSAFSSKLAGTIIGAVVGVLVFFVSGCIGYCRYRQTCCFKRKSISIPAQNMRKSDGTLIGVVGGAV